MLTYVLCFSLLLYNIYVVLVDFLRLFITFFLNDTSIEVLENPQWVASLGFIQIVQNIDEEEVPLKG